MPYGLVLELQFLRVEIHIGTLKESCGDGDTTSNQQQRRPAESQEQRATRVEQASKRKVRAVSAWNIFQRE